MTLKTPMVAPAAGDPGDSWRTLVWALSAGATRSSRAARGLILELVTAGSGRE
jgi:hypothetical protein